MLGGLLTSKVMPAMTAMYAVAVVSDADATLDWMIKGLIAVAFAIIAYFLKQTADTIRETKTKADGHDVMLEAHDAMYQVWLENLGTPHGARVESPPWGRRESDHMIRAMLRAKEEWRLLDKREGGDQE